MNEKIYMNILFFIFNINILNNCTIFAYKYAAVNGYSYCMDVCELCYFVIESEHQAIRANA